MPKIVSLPGDGIGPEVTAAAVQVLRDPQELRLMLEVDLPPGLGADQPLEAAITAVIQQRSGLVSYWALEHGGSEPDFHRREDFRLSL